MTRYIGIAFHVVAWIRNIVTKWIGSDASGQLGTKHVQVVYLMQQYVMLIYGIWVHSAPEQ